MKKILLILLMLVTCVSAQELELGLGFSSTEMKVCSTSPTKSYMSYKSITCKACKQYKFIQENMTVGEDGMLYDEDGFIGVALGSYFGEIGSRYKFTLDTGIELYVVKVEEKADIHTNNGCDQRWDHSVIEFVIDSSVAKEYFGQTSNKYVLHGNFNNYPDYKGKIEKIEKIEKSDSLMTFDFSFIELN